MGTEILKPVSGGNALEIQNDAGTSALKIASGGGIVASGSVFPGPPGDATGQAYGGHILQMVLATESAESNNGAATAWDSPSLGQAKFNNSMQVSIVPASTSNKILIQWCARLYSTVTFAVDFYREISGGDPTANLSGEASGLGTEPTGDQTHSYWFLDSPATTSEVTYRPSAKSATADNVIMGDTDRLTQIIAFEIQG